jgi:hypothetical protein
MFLAAGGNALTCGNTGYYGGLGAVFPEPVEYPASVLDDIANFDYDMEYAKHSLAYDDYYVTVVDKVLGQWRMDMPEDVIRSLDRDAMRMAYQSGAIYYFNIPDTLTLWDGVTQPGMFFDPAERGFYYVEAYDPGYYMDHIMEYSHPCFTPLYRMKARSSLSPLDDAVIAMKVVQGMYAWEYPRCEPGRFFPYDSYHFGIPLWFIDHGQAEQIADFVFAQWDIR